MKVTSSNFFHEIKKGPEQFFLVHYSSQSLFDEDTHGLSPRITSVVVMHYATRQTESFAIHTMAELLGIEKGEVERRYDEIEKEMLARFFAFTRDRLDRYWIHWNMRNITFGFEHLEHRSMRLGNAAPATIPMEQRLNLNDILKQKYGADYAPDPRMKSLVELNGKLPPQFMGGDQEAAAFAAKDFIRMHASTICKVEFFRHAIVLATRGKLKTASKGWGVWVDRLLEGRSNKVIAVIGTIIGAAVGLYQTYLWLKGL